tara:strand:+ start:93 stop:734 length:642 start_codon:yes stop_codon:yes gene_type:complete
MIEQVDFDKYSESYEAAQSKSWLMDKRHISIIHNIIMCNSFKRILQIGIYTGFSSSATFTALDKGKNFDLHLVDVEPQHSVEKLIEACDKPDNISVHSMLSSKFWPSLSKKIDLVIIDGGHTIPDTSIDLFYSLENNIQNIISHDSNAWVNPEWGDMCIGSKQIARILQNDRRFHCLEDKKNRPNESTYRGLVYATMKEELFEKAKPIFKELT